MSQRRACRAFKGTNFRGQYPFASIEFEDERHARLASRSKPIRRLLPLNPEDSGIPCAILTYKVTNTTEDAVDMSPWSARLSNSIGRQPAAPTKYRNDLSGVDIRSEQSNRVSAMRHDLRGLLHDRQSSCRPAMTSIYGSLGAGDPIMSQ